MKTVDVIIPTYKPDLKLIQLINSLLEQTVKVNKIILVNTEEKYFQRLVYGKNFLNKHSNIVIYHHSRKEFDHGNSRNLGVKHSTAEYFLMMTQDAVPTDLTLVEKLLKAFDQEQIAVAYARQLPNNSAGEIETFTRQFNYPDQSRVKSENDLEKLGIKTYFCSNVCAMYQRDVFEKLGGFIRKTIFNEDMIFAAKAISNHYKIAYVAKATVIHSHSYGYREQLRRNFDLGVSQADHPEVFANVKSESEGKKMVVACAKYLMKKKKPWLVFDLFFASAFKYLGYQMGRNYKRLPEKICYKVTMNREYWRK